MTLVSYSRSDFSVEKPVSKNENIGIIEDGHWCSVVVGWNSMS